MKCLAVVCMVCLLAPALMAAESPVVEKLDSGNAWINWERQVVKAVGIGVLPGDASSPQEAEQLARQAAGINAYRNMEAAIRMVRVHGETLVGSVTPEIPEIKLKQLAHSAEVVSDRQRYDRAFEVIVQVPLGRVAAILPRSDRSDTSDTSDQESPAVRTELVIDARGLDLLPALQPGVFDKAGNEVYSGTVVYSARVTAGDVMKALEVRDLTDLVVEGQVQAGAQVTILVSPVRESCKTP